MITIRLIDNTKKPAHKDVLVNWREISLSSVADSYFFVLHEGSIPESGTFQKASAILKIILSEWKIAVQSLQEGGVAYLPFDFSDEYIGFLKAKLGKYKLEICYGATQKLYGWNIDPLRSVPLPIGSADEAFIDPGITSISVDEFVAQIEQSIQNIGS